MVEKPLRNDENKENGGSVAAFFDQVIQAYYTAEGPRHPKLPATIRPQMDPVQSPFVDPAVVSVLPLKMTSLILTNSLDLPRLIKPVSEFKIRLNKNARNIPKKVLPLAHKPLVLNSENYQEFKIKFTKTARNIPKKLLPLVQPLSQNYYQGRRSPEFIRLMDPSKCRPKDQNHPQNQSQSPKDPIMEESRKDGLLSKLENGACLSDALREMMNKDLANEYLAYQKKYLSHKLHLLWQNDQNELGVLPQPQVATPFSSQCRLHPTHSLVFCSQCDTGNPARATPALGRGVQPGDAQGVPAPGGGADVQAPEAAATEAATEVAAEAAATILPIANETATHVAAQVAQTAANEDATQVAAQASEAAVAEAAAAETAALQAATPPRGSQAAVEEIPAPFGSMEYMPEAWRNFKIDLEEFLPSSTDAELIKLYCNFI